MDWEHFFRPNLFKYAITFLLILTALSLPIIVWINEGNIVYDCQNFIPRCRVPPFIIRFGQCPCGMKTIDYVGNIFLIPGSLVNFPISEMAGLVMDSSELGFVKIFASLIWFIGKLLFITVNILYYYALSCIFYKIYELSRKPLPQ